MSSNTKKLYLEGYNKDIAYAIAKVKNTPITTADSKLFAEALYQVLDSYLFENNFKYKKLGHNDQGQYCVALVSNHDFESAQLNVEGQAVDISKYNKLTKGVFKRVPFLKDIDINHFPYTVGLSSSNKEKLTETTVEPSSELKAVLDVLKEMKPCYAALLEENPLKRSLHQKMREEISFSYVPEHEFKTFLSTHSKLQDIDTAQIIGALKNNNDLRFLSDDMTSKDTRNFYIIAHNSYEIAGVTSVRESETLNNSLTHHRDRFMTVSSVMVASNYRGRQLGVKMFEEVMKDAAEKDYIVIRTMPSENGRNYLKDNITKKAQLSENITVVQAEIYQHLKEAIPKLFNNQSFESGRGNLRKIIAEVENFQALIKAEKAAARDADAFYAIEDKENNYYESLTKKIGQSRNKLIA